MAVVAALRRGQDRPSRNAKPIAFQAGWVWVGTDLSEAVSVSETTLALRLLAYVAGHVVAASTALYDILEHEVIPLFYDQADDGVPYGWVRRVKASLKSIAPRFNATRMMNDYARDVYRTG